MAFLKKLFKREKGEDKSRKTKKEVKEEPMASVGTGKTEAVSAKSGKAVLGVFRASHITEKTSNPNKENKYVFEVDPRANKPDIKRATEGKYGVNVLSVDITNIPGKERRRGRQIGWKQGYKKAVVTLRKGQTIEVQ